MRRRDFIGFAASSAVFAGFQLDRSVVMKFLDSDTPLFPYRGGVGREWGFIDKDGNVAIPPANLGITTRLADFNEGLAAMEFAGGESWMIDLTGAKRFAIDPQHHGWNYTLRDGLLPYRDPSGTWGYLDKEGRIAIGPQFEMVWPFSEKRAMVKTKPASLFGIIDERGNWVVQPQFKFALSFREGLAPAGEEGNWLFVDRAGRPAFSRTFEWARQFGGGMAPVRQNKRWGAINRKGDLVVACEYDDAWSSHSGPSGGPLMVKQNGKWGFVDSAGRVVVEPKYHFAYGFSLGIATVQLDSGQYQFIDASGAAIFDRTFDSAYHFVLDRAPVRISRENLWIDRTGKTVFQWR